MGQVQDILCRGGAPEVSSVELAQPVLVECLLSPGKCGALAQDALGCEGSLATECVGPAQDILDRGGVLETRSAEPAQPVLAGCSRGVRGAGTERTGLWMRTGDTLRISAKRGIRTVANSSS